MVKVIGAGFGRTGTFSLKAALEELGFGPCYHMFEIIEDTTRAAGWSELTRGGEADLTSMLEGFESAVDWPACAYWEQIAKEFPDAKIVLTVRDPDSWYRSMQEMQRSGGEVFGSAANDPAASAETRAAMLRLGDLVNRVIWFGTFRGRFANAEHAKKVFTEHNQYVQEVVPADRLLVFRAEQGWGPLCEFLEVPEPVGKPFPRLNDIDALGQRIGGNLIDRPANQPFHS